MISKSLAFTHDILDQFIRNRFGTDESKVVLNSLVEPDGTIPLLNRNKLVVSLINIEKEYSQPYYVRNEKLPNGDFADTSPPSRYLLDILISSNFDDYGETLKFLDAAILFFQLHSYLDAHSFASIPAGLIRLEFEIDKIVYHQMHSLWTAMGAKYQPSVIYKTRLVTIKGDEVSGFTPGVKNVGKETRVKV
jgi:hypothetical protein